MESLILVLERWVYTQTVVHAADTVPVHIHVQNGPLLSPFTFHPKPGGSVIIMKAVLLWYLLYDWLGKQSRNVCITYNSELLCLVVLGKYKHWNVIN